MAPAPESGPRIRPATPLDAAACAAIYRPIVLETGISFEWTPPTPEDFARRIERVTATHPWLVSLDGSDAVSGFVYAHTHRDAPSYQWSVNTSVFIRSDARSRGLGSALYRRLFEVLVDRGYAQAFAGVALPNDASVALHERVGFRRIGVYEKVGFKFGRWRDVAWFQRTLRTLEADPVPPGAMRPSGTGS